MEQLDLIGETIVVTGAGSGIGEGIARAAAAHDMKVVLSDIRAERVDAVAAQLRDAGAEVVSEAVDVRDPDAMQRLADLTFATFGGVRVLVNNAGVEATGYTWEMSPAQWENVIRVNLIGVFNGVRAFLPRMLEQGTRASIVNLSSIAALASGPPQQSAYNASKHGVQALTECLHLELREIDAPVSVHVVNPGPVSTRIFADASAEGAAATDSLEVLGTYVTDHGLTGLEAGRMILAAVGNNDFWITTHPGMRQDAIARRTQMLSELSPPALVPVGSLGAQ
jgi:NAD(P)-dependent dehydrogenase (short-subunit alcohol dehydrogenase family)